MQLQSFDAEYVRRLTTGDAEIENHFALYFGNLLTIKLRMRLHARQLIDDIRQETLMRVMETLRQKQDVVHPERFGAFVNAVCNNVMMELGRAETRHDPINGDQKEPPDCRIDLDAPLIDSEIKRQIERVLNELPLNDHCLLREVYLDEVDRSEVCRLHGVDSDYLRVLLHRAKSRFRKVYWQHGAEPRVTSHAA